jgi:hypothetical protein
VAANIDIDTQALGAGQVVVTLPFDSVAPDKNGVPVPTHPGIEGSIRLVISGWNTGMELDG